MYRKNIMFFIIFSLICIASPLYANNESDNTDVNFVTHDSTEYLAFNSFRERERERRREREYNEYERQREREYIKYLERQRYIEQQRNLERLRREREREYYRYLEKQKRLDRHYRRYHHIERHRYDRYDDSRNRYNHNQAEQLLVIGTSVLFLNYLLNQ